MLNETRIFYPILVEPVYGSWRQDKLESSWHQAWSEPVRVKINPRLAIALIASGPFAPALNDETQIINKYESRWHQPWSEPVRVKPRLRVGLEPTATTYFNILPNSGNLIQGWYQVFRDPVWLKKGLGRHLQLTETHPPRYLPVPNVTGTMSAQETSHDSANFGVWVYTSVPPPLDLTAVDVSVSEIMTEAGAAASIKESN